ncbi:MAG: rod shape-determining protein MreC [Thermodesulfobacteriota bacterium]|nr:rod shape-determining protein MreC [Thermodesulfobacteriota bacterium]
MNFFESLVFEISIPIQKCIIFPIRGAVSTFRNYLFLISLKEENNSLKNTIKDLKDENLKLKEAYIENLRLRKLLDFKETFNSKIIPSEVIGRDPTNWFKTVLIDKGQNNNIENNMTVVTSDGIVGRIIEVSRSYAKVLLIIDNRSAVDAMVQRTRAKGILVGKTNRRCELKYALRSDDIEIGDYIISSGLGGIYPKGLLLGKVSNIKKDNFGMFQFVEVMPFVNFNKLEEVLILASKLTSFTSQ